MNHRRPHVSGLSPRRAPWLAASLFVGAVVGLVACRGRPPPRTAPRAKLEIVRVDDEADPLGPVRAPALPDVEVTLARELFSSPGKAQSQGTFAQLVLPASPTGKDAAERVTAWLGSVQKPPGTRFVLGEQTRRSDDEHEPGATKVWLRSYLLTGEPIITSVDVIDAKVERQSFDNRPSVLVKLSSDGAKRFGDATRAWQGQRLAIVLDDRVMSAPRIMSAIEGGQVSITLGHGPDVETEAKKLAEALRP